MNKKKIIIFTGGNGRFGRVFQSLNKNKKILFPSKSEFNILSTNNMRKYVKRKKPNYIIHGAGLSRPMSIHDKDINKKVRKLALKRALSERIDEGSVIVLDKFDIPDHKTKSAKAVVNSLKVESN